MKAKLYSKLFCLGLLLSLCSKVNAQSKNSPVWSWAKSMGSSFLYISAIAIDPSESEDVYIAGAFSGEVDFDPGPEIFNLYSFDYSIFIVKYDSSGNFLWAKAMTGSNAAAVTYSMAIDPMDGSVYTTGEFYGTIDFDPGIDQFSLTGIPGSCQELDICGDIFISKLDRDGNFNWALRIGGPQNDLGSSLVVDDGGSGDIYLTGYFSDTVDFDPGAEVSNITSVGDYDVFISRVNSSGQFLWTKPIGGMGGDVGHKIAFDPSGKGNVYIIGTFEDTVDFNPGSENYFLNAATNRESFITKFDSSGNFLWAKQVAKANFEDITLDHSGSGDIYTSGYFWDTCDFNPAEEIFTLIAEEEVGTDIFILKLSDSGTFKWAKSIDGSSHDNGTGITVQSGNSIGVYITGKFKGTCDFNPGADTFNITSDAGSTDIFISSLDSAGLFKWVKVIKGSSDEGRSHIATKQHGVYLTGSFSSSLLFFDSMAIHRTGGSNFIAKLESEITTKVMSLDAEKYQMIIYPNPANNELTIELEGDEIFNVDITLFNVLGEVVYYSPGENFGQQKTIDISALGTGLYFIEINLDGGRVMKKVVKE